MSEIYKKVEFVVNPERDNGQGFVFGQDVNPGTTLADQRKLTGKRRAAMILDREIEKNCAANYVPGLVDATTIVHIPTQDSCGEAIPSERWNALFLQASALYGVPMWTQSSIKSTTFYFVKPEMFEKLADEYDRTTMGHRFAAYSGLLFSEMTDDKPLTFNVPEIKPEGEANDGIDGNCLVNKAVWGERSQQFREWRFNPVTGMPNSYGKGIALPKTGVVGMELNASQVKMGAEPGTHLVLRNKDLNGKQHRVWISAEPILILKNVRPVRRFLMRRVMTEVAKLVALLSEEHRVDLLRMLGGLKITDDGQLEEAQRAVIDMLRSNIPWCAEVEQRITRFMIRLITRKIVPSGGIYGWSSLLVISNEHGVAPCTWADAKCFAIRIPTTGAFAIVPLPKNPYKENLGNVVTAEVAMLVSGDGDGDELVIVTDPYVVDLFRKYLNWDLVGGLKPEKDKYISELNAETMQDVAMEQVANAWMVGTLTTKAWTLIEEGQFQDASLFLEAANIEPMTYKHKVTLYGKPFKTYVYDLLRKYKDLEVDLEWRDRAIRSEAWRSIRAMSDEMIEKPKGLVGFLWNAGVAAVSRWSRQNPMQQLSLSRIQRLIFAESGREIPGVAYREMREIVTRWGKFWADHIDKDGNVVGDDIDDIYDDVRKWSEGASDLAKAALLAWRPKNGDGFGLKFQAIFARGDGVRLLGYHPDVAKFVEKRTKKLTVIESILFGQSDDEPRVKAELS